MAEPKEAHREVYAANRSFYDAFESLDIDRMAEVWLRKGFISCTHPGWARLSGWGPVMESWEEIFGSAFAMKFVIADEVAHVVGDLAWVTCTEHIENRGYDGVSQAAVEATNVFQRDGSKWLMVHHHGSPLVRAPDPSESRLQ